MKNIIVMFGLMSLFSCTSNKTEEIQNTNFEICTNQTCTDTLHTNELIIYTPHYSSIDLVCGDMPSVRDSNVLFCAEAAYTGECLKEFIHSNIAGNHVTGGLFYKGYSCKRNTGAFAFYNDKYKFLYRDYANELDSAAENGGMFFGQEMIIHNGKFVDITRKDNNKNEFRALCELNDTLCVIDSRGVSTFGDFKRNLLDAGVTEALYLDMGTGWNFSWWRDSEGKVNYIHKKRIVYTTNWITFYK